MKAAENNQVVLYFIIIYFQLTN